MPGAPRAPGAAQRGRATSLAGGFPGAAAGRLLPGSVPFRYFGAAVAFHALAWLALAAGARDWPQWRGGLGWPLAALHLITVGTLLASAIGASLQLLPVATRQPVRWPRLAGALWWLYVPGTATLALGMGLARPALLGAGATVLVASLAVYALLLAGNLRGARGMPGVVLHGWGALAALVLLGLTALALVALWLGRPTIGHDAARALHLIAGTFGFMGMLAVGLSYILLPMFALSAMPQERAQIASGAAALAAVVLGATAAFGFAPVVLRLAALVAGGFALALHLRLMRVTLATGMRPELGRSLRLMRLGWWAAALTLGLALALVAAEALGLPAKFLGRLFVLAAIVGWLLSFLFGVMQRVLPFLASMHAAAGGRRRPPTPSALTLDWPLGWHFGCHLGALALLAAAIVADSSSLALAAAAVGAVVAIAFGLFVATLLERLRLALAGESSAGRGT
ncbi:MAG: hypothetical protein JSW68_07435 [Burkholderiales bacterium]|nr:MAG: hypothetical protein JSW68_07435 [Burkholderiales bacterium]